ncbi:hypothetical protein C4D60_Mb04t37700 [Musa balbisiana]|uniref:NAC domain-containing protein n=1 Tax=Musa balbisiana TaxID=52838 RepID=A0A4V4HAB2_MUSBA|nr:hypothetical protein C4D60_Mb04t37700 [Musa balbisiana]
MSSYPQLKAKMASALHHPEKLPGVTRDGLSKHFFHRPSKAYTTGTRKRRKIQSESDLHRGETRWHKTGKTRPVMVDGTQKGCKKILVLYTNFGKHRKPVKTNWVMHQYHLGELEEEKDGELVVSKVFYQIQPRQWSDKSVAAVEGMSQRRDTEVLSKRDEYLYSSMGMHQHVKPDNFSFAPFTAGFNEVAVGEASDEHAEHERHVRLLPPPPPPPYHQVARQQQQQQQQWRMATTTAAFHSRRPPMNPISKFVPTPLQQTSIVLEDPYQVPRMLLQPDKFLQQKLDHHRSTSGLEELIMSCTSAGIKGYCRNVLSKLDHRRPQLHSLKRQHGSTHTGLLPTRIIMDDDQEEDKPGNLTKHHRYSHQRLRLLRLEHERVKENMLQIWIRR